MAPVERLLQRALLVVAGILALFELGAAAVAVPGKRHTPVGFAVG